MSHERHGQIDRETSGWRADRAVVIVCRDDRYSNRLVASLPSDLEIRHLTPFEFERAPHSATLAVLVDAAAQSTGMTSALEALHRIEPTAAIVWIGAASPLRDTASVVVDTASVVVREAE